MNPKVALNLLLLVPQRLSFFCDAQAQASFNPSTTLTMAFLLSILLTFVLTALAERIPRQVTWTGDTFGPDGPWRAVNVGMGRDQVPTSLYPGGTWQTWLIEDDYCQQSKPGSCYASDAGTYDESSGDRGSISIMASLSSYMLGVELAGDAATRAWMTCR